MKGTIEAIYNTERKEDRTSQVERLSGERKNQRNQSPPMFNSGNKDAIRQDMYGQMDKGDDITVNSSKVTRIIKNKMGKADTKEFQPKSVKRELSTDSEDSDYESRRSLRQSIQNRLKINRSYEEECGTPGGKKATTEVSPLNSENTLSTLDNDVTKERQKKSLLEKVNEIIKSCVKLKDENKVTGSKLEKANKIIQKAEEKKLKLTNQEELESKTLNLNEEKDEDTISLEEKELNKPTKEEADLEEGEITDK